MAKSEDVGAQVGESYSKLEDRMAARVFVTAQAKRVAAALKCDVYVVDCADVCRGEVPWRPGHLHFAIRLDHNPYLTSKRVTPSGEVLECWEYT